MHVYGKTRTRLSDVGDVLVACQLTVKGDAETLTVDDVVEDSLATHRQRDHATCDRELYRLIRGSLTPCVTKCGFLKRQVTKIIRCNKIVI